MTFFACGNLFAATIGFTVDPTSSNSPISPQAYGSNASITDANGRPVTNNFYRQGGNRMTGYNWENNASNSGADYCQSSGSTICSHEDNYMFPPGVSYANNQPATTLTAFVLGNNSIMADSLITLQMAGYVSTDPTCNCFVTITGASDATGTYWETVSFVKGSAFADPPVTSDYSVYMDELMHYLGVHLGYSATGGAKYYDLDNEPALWISTHPMIHPTKPTCAEVSSKGVNLANVITYYDPGAQILGPVAYGWSEYVNNQSAADITVTNPYNNGNGIQYLNYYLAQFSSASSLAGRRLLHYLDLHWYPEATGNSVRITNDDVTQPVAIARMQAPRSLWDPTYVETSWITSSISNKPITLIPRLQNAVNSYYPGTKLSFTEYQYGAGEDISGGIAEADALGIFSKYGVMASWWPDGSANDAYLAAAFNFYLNYDGAGSKFGDTSISATSTGANAVSLTSVYAAKDNSHPNRINVVILNKDYTNPNTASVTLANLAGGQNISSITTYRFDSGSSIIYNSTAPVPSGNTFSDALPFRSATLYQITLSQSFATNTPTATATPTFTATNTGTATFTNTGTILTNTPTFTPTFTFTFTSTPTFTSTNTFTPTATPFSTTCLNLFTGNETLSDNGNWAAGTNSILSIDTSSSAPATSITQLTHNLQVDITTGSGWNDQILFLTGFTPAVWDNVAQIQMDVYADSTLVTGNAWHQLWLYGTTATKGYQRLSTNFINLAAGENTNATFNISAYAAGLSTGEPLTSLFVVYNSQHGGTGNLYIDNVRVVTGCVFTPTPTPSNTPTITPTFTITFTPTVTNTGTLPTSTFTPTRTPTFTSTPTPSDTPSNGPPVGNPIVYYNPVTVSGPVTAVFNLRESASQLSLKIFTTAFRKVQETSMTNVPAGSVSVKLDLVDKFGSPLANGLYYLFVTAPQGHSVGKILILR